MLHLRDVGRARRALCLRLGNKFRSTTSNRLYGQLSSYHAQALLHGCEAETVSFYSRVKPDSKVLNLQPNAFAGAAKVNFNAFGAAVFNRIVKGLLGYSVKAKGNIV